MLLRQLWTNCDTSMKDIHEIIVRTSWDNFETTMHSLWYNYEIAVKQPWNDCETDMRWLQANCEKNKMSAREHVHLVEPNIQFHLLFIICPIIGCLSLILSNYFVQDCWSRQSQPFLLSEKHETICEAAMRWLQGC